MRTTDTPKSERMIKVLTYLIRNRSRQYTAADIHAYLNLDEPVSLRNVQRDLKELADIRQSCVLSDKQAGKQVYFIEPDMRSKMSLPIEKNAILALFVLKRLQPFFKSGTQTVDAMAEALEELTTRSDYDLFDELENLLDDQTHIMGEHPLLNIDATILNALIAGLMEKRKVVLEYLNHPEIGPMQKTICPAKMLLFKNELYFVCINEKYEDREYYIKVCRVLKADLLDDTFTVSKKQMAHITSRLAKSFGILDEDNPKTEKIKIRFPPWFQLILKERRFHPSQSIRIMKNASVELSLEAPVDRDLIQWVLGWADKAMVISPKSLKEELRQIGRKLANKYK